MFISSRVSANESLIREGPVVHVWRLYPPSRGHFAGQGAGEAKGKEEEKNETLCVLLNNIEQLCIISITRQTIGNHWLFEIIEKINKMHHVSGHFVWQNA